MQTRFKTKHSISRILGVLIPELFAFEFIL